MLQILVLMNHTILLVGLYGINCKLFSFFLSPLTHIFLCLVYFFLTLSFSSSLTLTMLLVSPPHHIIQNSLSLAVVFFFLRVGQWVDLAVVSEWDDFGLGCSNFGWVPMCLGWVLVVGGKLLLVGGVVVFFVFLR